MNTATELLNIRNKLQQRQERKVQTILPVLIETKPVEIGIYGSFARGDYKATSDIDMYILYKELPDQVKKGELYEEAEAVGIDLLIATESMFYHTDSVFCRNVLKDKKIIWKESVYES